MNYQNMKRLFLLCTFILSINLHGQDVPNWVSNPNLISDSLYIGKSLPTKEHPVERHIVAMFDAMASFASNNPIDTSKVFMARSVYSQSDNNFSTNKQAFIDWQLIDNYVDASGVEYVLLKITPGLHLFTYQEVSAGEWSNDVDFTSYSEKLYESDVYKNPVYIKT